MTRVSGERMIQWLENRLRIYNEMVECGADEKSIEKVLHEMFGCKDMIEALLGVTIQLCSDNRVVVC